MYLGQNGDIFRDRNKRESFYLDDKNDENAEGSDNEEETAPEAESPSTDDDGIMVDNSESDLRVQLSALSITQRQHSTTEYLPGMVHSNSPAGLLPKFPSWSLVKLCEYSSYSPSQGTLTDFVLAVFGFADLYGTEAGAGKELGVKQ